MLILDTKNFGCIITFKHFLIKVTFWTIMIQAIEMICIVIALEIISRKFKVIIFKTIQLIMT